MPDDIQKKDRFFKQQTVFDKVRSYFKVQQLQTSDSLETDLKVQTKDSLWFYSQLGNAYSWYEKNIAAIQLDRRRRYEEFNLMDQDAEVSAALSIWADEATSFDVVTKHVINVSSENEKVKVEIENLFFNKLQMEDQLWGLVRDLCKFGDAPFEIVLNEDENSISKLVPIPIDGFVRIEEDTVLRRFEYHPYAEMDRDTSANVVGVPSGQSAEDKTKVVTYDPFQVAHFSVRTNDPRFRPYGMSILEAARKIWKQLKILEESLIINRLTRAPERRVFYIDVGNLSPADANEFVGQIKANISKKRFMNPITGEVDFQASPLNQQEDIWIPRRGVGQGAQSEVTTLPGVTNDTMADINMFRDKMLAALKVPPAYLGRGGNEQMPGGANPDITKAGLSNLDKKFARSVQRIQKAVIASLYKVAYIQLYLKGYSKRDIETLELSLTVPSNLDEQTELEIVNARLTALTTAKAVMGTDTHALLPDEWVYRNIMRFTDDEIAEIKEWRAAEIPAAGAPGEGGGGGAMGASTGIEGEFDKFAAGAEGDTAGVPGEEGEAAPEGGAAPEAGAEGPAAPGAAPAPVAESNSRRLTKYVLAKRRQRTRPVVEHLTNLMIEGDFGGLLNDKGQYIAGKKLL